MANVNKTAGLAPVRYRNGTPWTGGGNVYYIAPGDTNAYAIGDPVTLTGGADANGVPQVTLATAGTANAVLGPVLGAGGTVMGGAYADPATPFSGTVIPGTKSKGYYVLVCDDPNVVFAMTDAGDGTPLAATNVNANANLKAGTNNGFVSGWQITDTGVGNGATLQLKLLGLELIPGNAFGQYAQWLVAINYHCFNVGTAGV